jgi:hypothetical protein
LGFAARELRLSLQIIGPSTPQRKRKLKIRLHKPIAVTRNLQTRIASAFSSQTLQYSGFVGSQLRALLFAVTRLVRSELYGIVPNDPLSILGAAVVLASVALLAGYIPAERATRIDPITALRYE